MVRERDYIPNGKTFLTLLALGSVVTLALCNHPYSASRSEHNSEVEEPIEREPLGSAASQTNYPADKKSSQADNYRAR